MHHILLAEDSTFFGRLVQRRLMKIPDTEVHWVQTRAEARTLLDQADWGFDLGIAGYDLPDAPDGELLEDFKAKGLSTLVFTGAVSARVRERVWALGVVDYLHKEDAQNLELLAKTVERLRTNKNIGVLVVDDAPLPRETLARMLREHRYTVFEAADGQCGLALLEENPFIRLVVTDFNMPGMDGFALTQAIRKKHTKNDLAIIGISARGRGVMAARFLKFGANDFIVKQSFLAEEFYSRVSQNIENLENIAKIRQMATTDSLTGLANRSRFFSQGRKMLKHADQKARPLCCAMMDLDHFKKVNDTYGHEAGDRVLKMMASILQTHFPKEVLAARVGGEEFALLLPYDLAESRSRLDDLRKTLKKVAVPISSTETVRVTTSIGLKPRGGESSLEVLLVEADRNLYRAKDEGRNRVVCDDA